MKRQQRLMAVATGILMVAFLAGCRKKVPVAAVPPPPQAPAAEAAKPNPPTISQFTAEPSHIERGQSSVLQWVVKDATQVEINSLGSVAASGRQPVKPNDSTTYTLTAKGPGGSATAGTTISVTLPTPTIPPPATSPAPTLSERLSKDALDVFFDFDRFDIRDDARTALTNDATALKSILNDFPNTTLVIEGHCDERGSAEYNLGLGDRRASAAKDFLAQLGVPIDRLVKVSYGKERPQCSESNEACWQKNRRVHFAPGENQLPKATSELQSGRGSVPASQTEKGAAK
ncbi:MAG: OmpA family protein [Ignavibacteriota bacterium]